MLVLSGGVSVGRYDYVRQVLVEMGADLLFWKVRQRPGKPLLFGLLEGKPVFGLPGNPTSSSICFGQYVRPAIHRMLGRSEVLPTPTPAFLDEEITKPTDLYTFARVRLRFDEAGRLRARLAGAQDSNLLGTLGEAEGLLHLSEPVDHYPAGASVRAEWLEWKG